MVTCPRSAGGVGNVTLDFLSEGCHSVKRKSSAMLRKGFYVYWCSTLSGRNNSVHI